MLTDNLPPRPDYFAQEADLNRRGAASLSELPPPAPLSAPGVFRLQDEGALVVDTHPAMQFASGHVPGSGKIRTTRLSRAFGWLASER